MIELLFIELGAVVTQALGGPQCAVEPFCDPAAPPTYDPDRRVEVDLARRLDQVLSDTPLEELAQRALYDQVVAPLPVRREAIGPSWPGGVYEGILSVREDVLRGNAILSDAAALLPGPRCRYQIVVSISDDRQVRRYHGFHAEVVRTEGAAIVLRFANRGGEIKYDPGAGDAAEFYAGGLVEGNLLQGGAAPGTTGALFMTQAAFSILDGAEDELPKLPPSAGL